MASHTIRQLERLFLHLLQSVARQFDRDAKLTSLKLFSKTTRKVIQSRTPIDAPIPQSGTDLVKPFST